MAENPSNFPPGGTAVSMFVAVGFISGRGQVRLRGAGCYAPIHRRCPHWHQVTTSTEPQVCNPASVPPSIRYEFDLRNWLNVLCIVQESKFFIFYTSDGEIESKEFFAARRALAKLGKDIAVARKKRRFRLCQWPSEPPQVAAHTPK